MEKEKINQFIMINGKFFPEMMIEDVKKMSIEKRRKTPSGHRQGRDGCGRLWNAL